MNGFNAMISVIIPIYNAVQYLERTLVCILNQTYKNLEIILIDDGSNDGSSEICDEYERKDNRIKTFHIKNTGVSNARNFGLKKARGEYVAFIDNDDYITPSYLKGLYEAMILTGCKASMCCYEKIKEENILNDMPDEDYWDISIMNSEKMLQAIMAIPIDKIRKEPTPYEFIWAKLYERNLLDGFNFRNLNGEDIEFNSRLYLKNFNFAFIHSTKYFWIQRPSSLHKIRNAEGFENHLKLFLSIINNLPNNDKYLRGLGLKKLMLATVASRYAIKKYNYNKNSIEKVKYLLGVVKKKYYKEFFKNKTIPILFKILILNYILIPQTYSLSRWLMEKLAKYK